MQSKNRVWLSAAGSGKTTTIVREALASNAKIAILTYTNNNIEEIRNKFHEEHGGVPQHVAIYTWYAFLLRECIRPYQALMYEKRRIDNVFFVNGRSSRWAKKKDVTTYYINDGKYVYSDKASDFVIQCSEKSEGKLLKRLSDMFDHIYIDEVQDLAGYDLDLIELLFASPVQVTLVGDVRQATYATNNSHKNKAYKGSGVIKLFNRWKNAGKCELEQRTWSYRCNQQICDLADSLYPDMPATESRNINVTGHDGVFLVSPEAVPEYMGKFSPTALRYSKVTDSFDLPALNFGDSKGRTFDRVLIFPNKPLIELLASGDPNKITAPAKYYVAFTRARHSVAFVYAGPCKLPRVIPFVKAT
jgi:DNA helicase-2/ATP-dependent DNA helicase PcrA